MTKLYFIKAAEDNSAQCALLEKQIATLTNDGIKVESIIHASLDKRKVAEINDVTSKGEKVILIIPETSMGYVQMHEDPADSITYNENLTCYISSVKNDITRYAQTTVVKEIPKNIQPNEKQEYTGPCFMKEYLIINKNPMTFEQLRTDLLNPQQVKEDMDNNIILNQSSANSEEFDLNKKKTQEKLSQPVSNAQEQFAQSESQKIHTVQSNTQKYLSKILITFFHLIITINTKVHS